MIIYLDIELCYLIVQFIIDNFNRIYPIIKKETSNFSRMKDRISRLFNKTLKEFHIPLHNLSNKTAILPNNKKAREKSTHQNLHREIIYIP